MILYYSVAGRRQIVHMSQFRVKYWTHLAPTFVKQIFDSGYLNNCARKFQNLNQSGDLLPSVCICFFYRYSSVNNFFYKIHRHVASVEERNRKFNNPLPLMALLWCKIYKTNEFLKNHLLFSMCIYNTKWQYIVLISKEDFAKSVNS